MYSVTWIINQTLHSITTPSLDAAMDVWCAMHDCKIVVRLWGKQKELML